MVLYRSVLNAVTMFQVILFNHLALEFRTLGNVAGNVIRFNGLWYHASSRAIDIMRLNVDYLSLTIVLNLLAWCASNHLMQPITFSLPCTSTFFCILKWSFSGSNQISQSDSFVAAACMFKSLSHSSTKVSIKNLITTSNLWNYELGMSLM